MRIIGTSIGLERQDKLALMSAMFIEAHKDKGSMKGVAMDLRLAAGEFAHLKDLADNMRAMADLIDPPPPPATVGSTGAIGPAGPK